MILPSLMATVSLLATPVAPAPQDARVRELVYAPGQVFEIDGAFRTATQIIFSPEETVRHAAIGDSVAWEVAVEGSVVFLKPRERHRRTNLLVVTERSGALRHYAFELDAGDAEAAGAAYQVRFRYPDDERAAAALAVAQERQAAERRLIALELDHGALEGPRNLAWSAQGDTALQPSETTDNGRFTVLRFPAGQAIPAIFEVTAGGEEKLIPYDVRGEWVVIHDVPRALRLRRGASVLCLFNEGPITRPSTPDTGTAASGVERIPVGDPQ